MTRHSAFPFVIIGILCTLLLGIIFFLVKKPVSTITSFTECAALYPVMESYPEQCQTPDGRHFVNTAQQSPVIPPQVPPTVTSTENALIQVTAPVPGETVGKTIVITGQAKGFWYFEASFPIEVRDANNVLLGQGPGTAVGDWMTEQFVPFTATITLVTPPTAQTGVIILKKDNPSGLPQNDAQIEIPIIFAP